MCYNLLEKGYKIHTFCSVRHSMAVIAMVLMLFLTFVFAIVMVVVMTIMMFVMLDHTRRNDNSSTVVMPAVMIGRRDTDTDTDVDLIRARLCGLRCGKTEDSECQCSYKDNTDYNALFHCDMIIVC